MLMNVWLLKINHLVLFWSAFLSLNRCMTKKTEVFVQAKLIANLTYIFRVIKHLFLKNRCKRTVKLNQYTCMMFISLFLFSAQIHCMWAVRLCLFIYWGPVCAKSLRERWDTLWTGYRSITGTHRDKHPFTLSRLVTIYSYSSTQHSFF